MPEALKKKNKDDSLYKRPPEIEAKLEQLEGVEPVNRIQLFEPSSRKHPDYISSEVLVYFLRRAWTAAKIEEFESIFKILMKRVDISLQSAIKDGCMERARDIREEILGRFAELIAKDCQGQSNRLDFYEIRFDKAFVSFRVSALRQIGPMADMTVSLSSDESDNPELTPEVEAAAANFLSGDPSKLDDPAFRFSLMAAIDKLLDDQKQVIGLLLQDFPIDSKDPNTMTIARILGCTERTVRNRRDRALKTLKSALQEEWVQ
jgi:hypothetical protein